MFVMKGHKLSVLSYHTHINNRLTYILCFYQCFPIYLTQLTTILIIFNRWSKTILILTKLGRPYIFLLNSVNMILLIVFF